MKRIGLVQMQIYTIGHSNHTREVFLNLLTEAKIEVLVDVRSNPNSRWAAFANRDSLKEIVESVQIQYIYLGDVLGGRPSDPDSYDHQTGKVDYQAIQAKEYFQRGIKRILGVLKRYRVCIMCAEEDPTYCHRNRLVAESLRQEGILVFHIRGDGRIQTDEELWKEKVGVTANQYTLPFRLGLARPWIQPLARGAKQDKIKNSGFQQSLLDGSQASP